MSIPSFILGCIFSTLQWGFSQKTYLLNSSMSFRSLFKRLKILLFSPPFKRIITWNLKKQYKSWPLELQNFTHLNEGNEMDHEYGNVTPGREERKYKEDETNRGKKKLLIFMNCVWQEG